VVEKIQTRREVVPLEGLHPELCSRVVVATAHAPVRIVELRHGETGDEYEVFAVAEDRFVHMLLTVRADGSVDESTHTTRREEIELVARGTDRATLRVPSDLIAVPLEIVSAISKTG